MGNYGSKNTTNKIHICTTCPEGRYQDARGTTKCEICKDRGKNPNKKQTACVKPTYLIPSDCDFTTQYLNTQYLDDTNQIKPTCASCPLGASCDGETTWKDVVPKLGWWRLEVAENSSHPPDCLNTKENKINSQPTCAFAPCLHPCACQGAPNTLVLKECNEMPGKDTNDTLFKTRNDTNKITNINIERCHEEIGYLNNCTSNNGKIMRCRLCATCKPGFKRTGSNTKCKKCPPTSTNRWLLLLGVFVMIVGSSGMIYMQITSEMSVDETSNTVKKIILNYLQVISLAGGLPLQWPEAINVMFDSFATTSSAGTTLLIPDCELSIMKPIEAFYYKQIAFTFLVPFIVILCITSWSLLKSCCRNYLKLHKGKTKDYTILSIVLLVFLCYPMLTKMTLSMLKCPWIGDGFWLMADLQEPCFENNHLFYLMLLTIPQIILYIIGLPVAATILIMRNKNNLHKRKFLTRYGLLYLGYRDERAWWEIVIAIRKVAIVSIGTFGTLLRVVDVQAHLALLTVFIAIVVHLLGKPFDMEKPNERLLYNFEMFALILSWLTFWGGLLFFLGKEKEGSVSETVKVLMTVTLVFTNCLFLLVSICVFAIEFVKDQRKATKRRLSRLSLLNAASADKSKIVPIEDLDNEESSVSINNEDANDTDELNFETAAAEEAEEKKVVEEEEEEEDFNHETSRRHIRHSLTHTRSTIAKAHAIHNEFHMHEEGFRVKTEERQKRAKRQTQLRLKARTRLKDSKKLHELDIFSDLNEHQVDIIIDEMDHIVRFKGQEICHQHDDSDSFYVIVNGAAVITVDVLKKKEIEEKGKEKEKQNVKETEKEKEERLEDEESSRPEQFEVGRVDTLGFVGEAALLEHGLRTATVTVSSDKCDLLRLKRSNFLKIIDMNGATFKDKRGKDHKSVIEKLKAKKMERTQSNRRQIEERRNSMEIRINSTTKNTDERSLFS